MKKVNIRNFNLFIVLGIFLSICFITVGYSAINAELTISGNASYIPPGSIYVSSVTLIESANATESFSPTFTDSSTNIGINIPSSDSSFTYEITITNSTDNYFHLVNIDKNANNNDVLYLINNLYIYDEFPPNSETKFYITYEAAGVVSNSNLVINLEYVFSAGGIYRDPTLNGADPDLIDGLIPIVYNDDIDKWEKADVVNNQWYDYNIQKWANATSVIASTKDYYVAAQPGIIVELEHMTSMMVWIPRYSYTFRETYGYQGYGGNAISKNTPGAFDIKFGDNTMLDTGSAKYTGNYPENYYTSPAFCWGNTCDDPVTRGNVENVEIPGFWIAKFEASKTGNLLYSKPNVTPMNYMNIASTFYFVQDLMNGMNGYNNYGFVGYVDAHLIKNTEWGALAYLFQSKYGKYGNEDYTGIYKEIYPNNCSNYVTGIGANAPSVSSSTATCLVNTYDTYEGMGASTTGNIYGVYDTVGGTFDRVMGTILNPSGQFEPEYSGFSKLPEGRYINVYEYGNYGLATTASIKGDALTDTLGLYGDRGITSSYLTYNWIYRGGSLYGDATSINGIFSYTTYNGIGDVNHSSRYTITIY